MLQSQRAFPVDLTRLVLLFPGLLRCFPPPFSVGFELNERIQFFRLHHFSWLILATDHTTAWDFSNWSLCQWTTFNLDHMEYTG